MPDLADRLAGLAPVVDADAGLDRLRRGRRTRRQLQAVAGVGSVALVLVGVVLVGREPDGDTVDVRGGGPDGAAAAATPVVASATVDGVTVTVTLPEGGVRVGGVLRATAQIRNDSDRPVRWPHGSSCPWPVTMVLSPVDQPTSTPSTEEEYWDGVRPLAEHVATTTSLLERPLAPPEMVDREYGCSDDLLFDEIAPGGSIAWEGATRFLVPLGPVGPSRLTTTFTGLFGSDDFTGATQPLVTVPLEVPVVDEDARLATADRALAAIVADARIAPFLQAGREELVGNPNPISQAWSTMFVWDAGAWELFLGARWGGGTLGLRYDAASGAVSAITSSGG